MRKAIEDEISRVWLYVVLLAIIAFMLLTVHNLRADEPPPAWVLVAPITVKTTTTPGNDPPSAWTGEKPRYDQARLSDGLMYEKHPDGVWRQLKDQEPPPVVKGTQGVVPTPTFQHFPQSIRNPSHQCPQCGRSQYVVSGPGPVPGTHTHRCPGCGTSWYH